MARPAARSRWKKPVFALVAVALALGLLELALAVAGVRPLFAEEDPYVGFAANVPLFVEQTGPDGLPVRATATNKLRFFNPQSFAARKPAGSFRVFCLGGSTTFGRPYDDATSFCGWLRALLARADPSRSWEVVNAGGISYASYRVARVAQELTAYEPDLFVVYSGQNEFLERRTYGHLADASPIVRQLTTLAARTRIYSAMARLLRSNEARPDDPGRPREGLLPREVATLLDRSVGPEQYERDDAFRAQVLEHYRYNLGRIVDLARSVGSRTILVAPASNLGDCAPFKSQHGEGFGEEEARRWEALMAAAATARERQDPLAALRALDAARSLDDRYAQLHFARGRVLSALGRHAEAKAAYERARDEDVCPLRALGAMGRIVRQVAVERDVPLVEFDRIAEEAAEHGIPGADLFLDHVHPTIVGNRRLALAVIDAMRGRGWLVTGADWGADAVAEVTRQVESGLDEEAHGRALRNLAKVIGWAGKLEEALRLATRATELAPGDAEAQHNLGLLLIRTGRPEAADAALIRATELGPDYSQAHYDLALLRQTRGDLAGAEASYLRAIEARPDYAEAHNNLGVVYERRGDVLRARAHYERALELAPSFADARHNLGWLLGQQGDLEAARREIEAAIDRQPRSADFHYSLGRVLARAGRWVEARRSFQRVLDLRPEDEAARQAIESLAARAD